MATEASNKIKYALATKKVDFANDAFKIILMATGFTFNKDTHHAYEDLSASELANGNGYTTGGNALAGVAVTEDDTDDRTEVTWNNTAWTASGGSIGPSPGAIIFDNESAVAAEKYIVGYIDFGGDQTQADGGVCTISNVEVRIA
jgi:hypothetical protein